MDYVEAHGSGTPLGDAIELSALHDVFGAHRGETPLHVGAVKTNIGHTQAAAGVAGLIKTVLVLEHGEVPPNLNLADPTDAIPADGSVRPVAAALPLPADRKAIAGVSSFGWSGTNAHLVLEQVPAVATGAPADPAPTVLPITASSPAALRDQLKQLAGWLAQRPDTDLADVAHTLRTGRAELDHRRAVVATGTEDAVAALTSAAADAGTAPRAAGRPKVAFLLPGTGDQYLGLGRELYRTEPAYAAAVDECIELTQLRCGVDLRPVFFPEADDAATEPVGDLAALLGRGGAAPATGTDPLRHAEIAHPFLFTVEYALAKLLAHWGVAPDVLVGYSLGEYVAACLAGVFTLSDALYVVVERARLIGAAPAGQMVAVAADENRIRIAIGDNGIEVDIAALNGPAMTVLSGVEDAIDAITRGLSGAGIACRPLRTAHAFHSSLLEPAREKLAALLESVPRHAPTTPIVSNCTGTTLSAEQAVSREYWADQLVNPVRFAESVRHCLAADVDVFVELGPGQTLGGLVRQNLAGGPAVAVLGTLPAAWTAVERPDEQAALLTTCGRLWELGVRVEWPAGDEGGHILSLPTYPFQRTRFWPEPTADGQPVTRPARPAGPAELCYAPAWRPDVSAGATPASVALPGSVVIFSDGDAGSGLADLVAATGTPVLEVVAGHELRRDGRRLVVDPADPAHHREVVAAACATDGPVHLAHLWSLLSTSDTPVHATDAELRDAVRYGFDSLLLALQAFGEHAAHREVRLLTVSRGATEILGGDVPAPYRAAPHGLARVAQHEYADLTWRGVDLDPEPVAPGADAGQLAHELLAATAANGEAHGTLAGWRRGRRWTQDWAKVSTSDEAEPESPWRPDGVYLITGGTRGLGLALAHHLVRSGVRKLALVARSAADVSELTAAGAEVLVLTADAGRPDELRAAVRDCRAHFGALHGVLHVAGLPASGMVARQTIAGAGAVLAPKVYAMGALAELVGPATPAELRPELLVVYSSAITAFGGIGEGDYSAANAVLDAYGSALAATAPSTKVLTVAWGPWRHDAWQAAGPGAASGLAERAGAYRERFGFTDEGGCAFLDRMVDRARGGVLAVRQPMQDALREWSAMVDLDSLVDASSVAPAAERFPRPQLRTEYAAPRTDLERTIAEVWQAYLGIDQVGVHDPFFDLGGNSLVGMAMVLAVEKELDSTIAPAVLFEHPTVAAFAAALDNTGGSDQTARELITTSSARGSRRRRARTDSRK